MDWDFKTLYGVAKDLILLAAVAYTWWANREKVTSRRFTAFEKNVAALEKDIAKRITKEALEILDEKRLAICAAHKLETRRNEQELIRITSDIRHLPGHKEIGEVYKRVDEVNSALNKLSGTVEADGHQMRLMLEELLKR